MVMSLPLGDKNLFVFLLLVFWPCSVACKILVLQPGMELAPPAVDTQSPNHWTTRLSMNNYWQENVGSHKKKIPHIQEQQRSPSKMVRGAKSSLESNPIATRDTRRAQTKPVRTRDPTETEPDLCLSFLWKYRSVVDCHRGRDSGCS